MATLLKLLLVRIPNKAWITGWSRRDGWDERHVDEGAVAMSIEVESTTVNSFKLWDIG